MMMRLHERTTGGVDVDLGFFYNAISIDSIGRIVLGKDLRQIEEMKYHAWSSSFQQALHYGGAVLTLLRSRLMQRIVMSFLPRRLINAQEQQATFSAEKVGKLLGDQASGNTIWDHIRRFQVEGVELPRER